VNGLTAARGLRRSLDDAGGVMRISVPALGDAFGRGRMTARARAGIEGVLQRAGVEVRPSLTAGDGDGWVTLRIVPGSVPPPEVAAAGLLMPSLPPRLAAATAVFMPLLVAVAIALGGGSQPAESTAATRVAPLERAQTALLRADYKTAIALTEQAAPARVPQVRATVVSALLARARSAQRQGQYAKAIRLARRASRFGRAPGAAQIVVQASAGLDLLRSGRSARR
jgi:hypothetical protein